MMPKLQKKILRKIPLFIIVVAAAVLLQSSVTAFVFTEMPPATAHWEITSRYNNHIGGVIEATLYVTTAPGVYLDWSKLPDVGDIAKLPPKVKIVESPPSDPNTSASSYFFKDDWYTAPPLIVEGEVEVHSRKMSRYLKGDVIVTEFTYEFQYLMPIDFSVTFDDKRLPPYLSIFQGLHLFNTRKGRTEWRYSSIQVESTDFYIVRRVDQFSKPILALFKLDRPKTYWPYVRLVGFGSLGGAVLIVVFRIVGFIVARRRQAHQDVISAVPIPTLHDFLSRYMQNSDYPVFVEAIKLYRLGAWGSPKADNWLKTTFILYSGIILTHDRILDIFGQLIMEVSDEHSS